MAVIRKKLMTRSGTWTPQGRQYRDTWTVWTDSIDDGPVTVLEAMGLENGDVYDSRGDTDTGAFLVSLAADEDSVDGKTWKVTAEYSWEDVNQQGGGADNNPLMAPLVVNWGFKDVELIAEFDHEGEPILNSAFDVFNPPLSYTAKIPILSVKRNEALGRYNPQLIYQFRDAVSSDSFAGADPGCAKVSQISGQRAYNPDIGPYYEVTYEFEFNTSGYRRRIPSLGMRQVTVAGDDWEPVLIKNQPPNDPVLLGEDGRKLDPEDPPYIMEFQIYPELPFSTFGFSEAELLAQQ